MSGSGHGRPGPFGRVDHNPGDRHPVDVAVEQRLPLRELNRRIREADARLTEALGDQRVLWLQHEELLTERCVLREVAHFDIGYEHGFAAGRADALRTLKGDVTAPADTATAENAPATQSFANRCRDQAIQTTLPRHLTIAAMLEAAWALAAGLHEIDDTDNNISTDRRNER